MNEDQIKQMVRDAFLDGTCQDKDRDISEDDLFDEYWDNNANDFKSKALMLSTNFKGLEAPIAKSVLRLISLNINVGFVIETIALELIRVSQSNDRLISKYVNPGPVPFEPGGVNFASGGHYPNERIIRMDGYNNKDAEQ